MTQTGQAHANANDVEVRTDLPPERTDAVEDAKDTVRRMEAKVQKAKGLLVMAETQLENAHVDLRALEA